jgi:hypothetical protein
MVNLRCNDRIPLEMNADRIFVSVVLSICEMSSRGGGGGGITESVQVPWRTVPVYAPRPCFSSQDAIPGARHLLLSKRKLRVGESLTPRTGMLPVVSSCQRLHVSPTCMEHDCAGKRRLDRVFQSPTTIWFSQRKRTAWSSPTTSANKSAPPIWNPIIARHESIATLVVCSRSALSAALPNPLT